MNTFKEDLAIDPNALDVEWLDQPKKFFDVAEQAAEARRGVDRAKLALEVTEAELDNDIRTNPLKYGIAKITEPALKAAMRMTDKYQKAQTALADAQYEKAMLDSATQAWDQRKRAIENLVSLHGQSYYASPSAPRDLAKKYMEETDKRRIRTKGKENN